MCLCVQANVIVQLYLCEKKMRPAERQCNRVSFYQSVEGTLITRDTENAKLESMTTPPKHLQIPKSKLTSTHEDSISLVIVITRAASYNITIAFFWLIALQMHTAYSPALNSRTATWRMQCAVKRELPAHHCLILQAPANRCFIRTANYRQRGMWKRHPASRGTQRAHTLICTHTRAERHPRFGAGVCAIDTAETSEFPLRFTTVHPSPGTGQQNDTANWAAVVGQWQKDFSGPNLRPLNSAVLVCILP